MSKPLLVLKGEEGEIIPKIDEDYLTIDERVDYCMIMSKKLYYANSPKNYHHTIYIVDLKKSRIFSVGNHFVHKDNYIPLQNFFDNFDSYIEMIENENFDVITGMAIR